MGTGVDNGAPPPFSPPPRPPDQPWTPRPPDQRPPAGGPVPPAQPDWSAPRAPNATPDWSGAAAPSGQPGQAAWAGPPAPPAPSPWAAPAPATPGRRPAARKPASVAVCLVLGIGLLGGAVIGSAVRALTSDGANSAARGYAEARTLWHSEPVDDVFPPTVKASAAGPGGADRTWIRVGVAPDSGCDGAFDAKLAAALAPAGCVRLLRATYTDATSTDVTTVGLLVTTADPAGMAGLRARLTAGGLAADPHAMPLPVPFPGTDAARFGAAQRGSWTVNSTSGLPIVVYAVSGFADGRAVASPQNASAATADGATTVPAQAGLGNEATGLAAAVANRFVAAVHQALDGAPHPGAAS